MDVSGALSRANAEFHYDFPDLEAFVVTLPAAALNGIVRNPFVVDVEEDAPRYPIEPVKVDWEGLLNDSVDVNGQVVPWGIDAVQARDVWDADRDAVIDDGAPTSEGKMVCIIDTGYYQGHEDLPDALGGMSQVDDAWSEDGYGHGSHVGGTIAAENNGLGVVGVTPGTVSLYIVKFFANDGSFVRGSSDLVAAIYECANAGADVISMSLGGSSSNRKELQAFNQLYAEGILHVAAAGNEQETTPGAYSYPASYDSVISVAAVDPNLQVAPFSLQNDKVEIAAPGMGVLSTLPYVETTSLTVDGSAYSALHVEYAAYGDASGALVNGGLCDSTGAWSGKVVLCQRGTNTFAEKVLNVQNSGGTAAIIYNNVAGDLLATLGEEVANPIIAITVTQEDGQYLVANKLGSLATVSSEYSWPASGYEAWDGTSMATPHVSAVAALVWSAFPELTNAQIRTALTSTAIDLGIAGKDNLYGYGLVQAKAAIVLLGGVTPPPDEQQLQIAITSPSAGAVYTYGAVVPVNLTITAQNAPVPGAAVKVVITDPRGKTKTFTGTTASDGTVSFSYQITYRKAGTFKLDATASLDGYLPGTASTTFVVK